eukprot:gb/GECG01016747.1/.p1 GENE.gb/GECG01016747.1/~~gb/GECG01016747.1/.p1  ORF type:complete len:738 (+),score=179.40 gb/GECG01016747.1/:1-2214(+)
MGKDDGKEDITPQTSAQEEAVKVAVRCRPFNTREKNGNMKCVVETEERRDTKLYDPENPEQDPKVFTYDHSYFWDCEQETVYNDIGRPIVDKALQGYNGTIFAYGQTGSGKSYCMMGEDENPGIIPRLNQDLFKQVETMKEQRPNNEFMILVSYLEIYNEVIKDLLNPTDKHLKIREHPKMGVYVQDLAELVVEKPEDVTQLLEQGNKVRRVAATNMNDRSSRSHSCFIIRIEQKEKEDMGDGKERETKLSAKINLVDLAGSERAEKTGAEGQRLKEGAAINKSLSTLGNVINALARGKNEHIPYRDSKLTRLLQQSLGGNSLTVMIATISPADDNRDETLSTLQYANRAKAIKNQTKKNEDVTQQIIRELREEIEDLRNKLREYQNEGNNEVVAEMNEKLENLNRAKNETWEEKQRLSKLYEEERQKNIQNEQKIRSVMSSIKDDNKELLKRMNERYDENNKLKKQFKQMKEKYLGLRDTMASKMTEYQRLYDEDGGEDGPNKDRLADVVSEIEETQSEVEKYNKQLNDLKSQIEENDRLLNEEKAEAAAQRMMLEEDAELRKAIQEEERANLEKQNEEKMNTALEEERKRLKEEAEREKQELLKKFGEEDGIQSSQREHDLELELLQVKKDKSLLALEVDRLKNEHEQEMNHLKQEHEKKIRELKRKELHMFRELTDGFEEQKSKLEKKLQHTKKLLRHACDDINTLLQRNKALEAELGYPKEEPVLNTQQTTAS